MEVRKLFAVKEVRWWVWLLVRVGFYLCLFALLLSGNKSSNQVVVGLTSGVFLGDYLTWLVRKLITLTLYDGFALETALNIMLVVLVMKFTGIVIPTEGEGMAFGFLAFLAIGAIKLTVYLSHDLVGND